MELKKEPHSDRLYYNESHTGDTHLPYPELLRPRAIYTLSEGSAVFVNRESVVRRGVSERLCVCFSVALCT